MIKYISLDLETYLISKEFPLPKPVCASFYDKIEEKENKILHGNNIINEVNNLEAFLFFIFIKCLEDGTHIITQNGASFDFPVIYYHFPNLRFLIIELLDKGFIHDTKIREQLYQISTSGEVAKPPGFYSLAGMVKRYLGKDISSSKKGPDIWRLRYHELDGYSVDLYPKEAREYALEDPKLTWEIFFEQEKIRQESGAGSINTESLQVKSAFILAMISSYGIEIDDLKLKEFGEKIDKELIPARQKLIQLGYASLNKKGQFIKNNKKFMNYLLEKYPSYIERLPLTELQMKKAEISQISNKKIQINILEGNIDISEDALRKYPPDEIIQIRLKLSLLEKYKGTYYENIAKALPIFKGSYDTIKNTGRTSGFIQTMPRDGGIREIFKARKNTLLLTADFSGLEGMCTAQALHDLNLGDELLKYLNAGSGPQDYHALLGHLWYAHKTQTRPDLERFNYLIKKKDPEAKSARTESKPAGLSIPGGVGNDTMQKIFLGYNIDISVDDIKQMRKYFYEAVPSLQLALSSKGWMGSQKMTDDKDKTYGYEVNGRYRNYCTYSACANGRFMQSLGADVAKEAMWEIYKNLSDEAKLVFFMHDEFGIEIPSNKVEENCKIIIEAMCRGAAKILKDCRITVEFGLMSHWSKHEENHIQTGRGWLDPSGQFFFSISKIDHAHSAP